VLLEKGVPHGVRFIDLANKPPWFLALSPMGRVPVLLVDGRPVFESMVINELIEELHPRPTLLPGTPLDRAEARSWIVFANEAVMPPAFDAMIALAGAFGGDALSRPLAAVEEALSKLEAQVARGGGPYFAGGSFTLVDAAYAPFLRRWRAAEGWGGPGSRLFSRFRVVSAWADALLERRSVRDAAPAEFEVRLRRAFEERAAKPRGAR
jgi:glutathione S-transferase